MYDTVIVPLDGSKLAERALDPAVEVARRAEAHLVATMVIGDRSFEEHHAYLTEVLARYDVPTRPPYIIPASDAAECIANAGEPEGSLVVMTTHGSSGIRRALLGSVAEGVVRHLAEPVLLVGPRYQPDRPITGGRVVIALDGSARAEAILAPVTAWCRLLDLEAYPVTAVDPLLTAELTAELAADPDVGAVADEEYVRKVATELAGQGIEAGWEVLHDDVAAGPLVDYARQLPASLMALATHGRTGAGRLVLGSVAAHVVHDATTPVLLLRPALEQGPDRG